MSFLSGKRSTTVIQNTASGVVVRVSNSKLQPFEIHNSGVHNFNYGSGLVITPNFVSQWEDTTSSVAQSQRDGAIFRSYSSGDGFVAQDASLSGGASQSVWRGLFSASTKVGDGSTHSFSANTQLDAIGAVGYNEAACFAGTCTNIGSTRGTTRGVEVLARDGTPTTSFDTFVVGVLSRTAKYKFNGIREHHSFMASSEGVYAANSVFGINPSGVHKWNQGIDFSNAIFTTGNAFIMPTGDNISVNHGAGVIDAIFGTSSTGSTIIHGTNATNEDVELATKNGTTLFRTRGGLAAGNPIYITVGGVLKQVTQGVVNSGGAGLRLLTVPN